MDNIEQSALWNEAVGQAWVTHADHFDDTLLPFGNAVLGRLALRSGERVVDIGCGTGATTVAIASLVAPASVTGVDLSAPMLSEARARAHAGGITNIDFVLTDVQAQSAWADAFDVAFSRFGVMFFSDPAAAFTNIRRSLRAGGRVGFVCFQGPSENPFILVPVSAAGAHLELPPPPGPNDPSPFAFADPDRVTSILDAAGFTDVVIEPGPTEAVLGSADDLQVLATRVLEQNPTVAPTLAVASPDARAAAIDAATEALRAHTSGGKVVLAAATWIVTCHC